MLALCSLLLIEETFQLLYHHSQAEHYHMVVLLNQGVTGYQYTFAVSYQSTYSGTLGQSHILYLRACDACALLGCQTNGSNQNGGRSREHRLYQHGREP